MPGSYNPMGSFKRGEKTKTTLSKIPPEIFLRGPRWGRGCIFGDPPKPNAL